MVTGIFMVLVAGIYVGCGFEPEMPKVREYPEIAIADFSPKSGKPNTLVTITGSNFGDFDKAATVTFGGVEATGIESIADEEIQVRVPQGAVSGEVKVKVWTHEKSFGEDAFTVLPSAAIDSISPESGAPGGTMTIYGQNFGTVKEDVSVEFTGIDAPVSATVLTVADTKIEVEIPVGGITGAITLNVEPETIAGPTFTYPFVGVDEGFSSDDGNWKPQQGGTATVADGRLTVAFADGTKSSTLQSESYVAIAASSFPYLAIRMTRLGDFDLSLVSEFGVFGGDVNQYTGILHGNVFYWDLTTAGFVDDSGNTTTMSMDDPTFFESLGFKIENRSNETEYSVDYIISAETMELLEEHVENNLDAGEHYYEFDLETTDPLLLDWTDHQSDGEVQEDGKVIITKPAGTNRAGFYHMFRYTSPGTNGAQPGDPGYREPWVYSPEYPIYAIRLVDKPESGVFRRYFRDVKGENGGHQIRDTGEETANYLDDGKILYWDCSSPAHGEYADPADFNEDGLIVWDSFGFQWNTLPQEDIDREIVWGADWVRTFKTVEDLKAFAENH
ncbi:uncharacterized protein DUF4979 [Marinoscillum furvescens DSM 4134]|uniref:Uncharacterized protein DUF4979 n=2 Tax=Marinoscillum furvescens TaxID=1026 RepID=A0A3D9L6M3_MARFU|nr:uncharacterized protein DUF4979 [Marinoscillum furvescens DSM 4134]